MVHKILGTNQHVLFEIEILVEDLNPDNATFVQN
jgi:hypothetical protein